MADRTGEAVEPHDDEGVAGVDVAEDAGEHRSATVGAGGVFFNDVGAAGGVQFVALGVRTLIIGGDPGIADEPAGEGVGEGVAMTNGRSPAVLAAIYNYVKVF